MYKRIKKRPQEPEQNPFPETYESEAGAAAAEKFLREPWNRHDYKENEPLVLPELINITFSLLALHFRSEAKGNSELAHKMAWLWLKGGFPFYPPPEIPQSALSAQLLWRTRASARVSNAERREWKVDTEPLISFEIACQPETDWCRYKSVRELISLLERTGCPKILLSYGLINRPVYEEAVQRDKELRKKGDAERKAKSRTKPLQQRKKQDSL